MADLAGRTLDAALHLLDRQIVDRDGRLAGKVDDLELVWVDGSNAPVVSSILLGPSALSQRLDGRLGALVEGISKRLHSEPDPPPASISFGIVQKVEKDVQLSVSIDDLEQLSRIPKWVSATVISRVPGAGRAPE